MSYITQLFTPTWEEAFAVKTRRQDSLRRTQRWVRGCHPQLLAGVWQCPCRAGLVSPGRALICPSPVAVLSRFRVSATDASPTDQPKKALPPPTATVTRAATMALPTAPGQLKRRCDHPPVSAFPENSRLPWLTVPLCTSVPNQLKRRTGSTLPHWSVTLQLPKA